jgi:hypothetical protein
MLRLWEQQQKKLQCCGFNFKGWPRFSVDAAKGARLERMPNISAAIAKTRTREKFLELFFKCFDYIFL